ncbi:non-ribosomal peptide synthetase [Pelagibaculum spongiae]|uniref:Carrier domain-containing protein n=1 Tax=Pelagibaculum spongiae TaxID=2080658 RepID=A0A2V1GUA4_9GAMM|nr:non-ribosomal peptide synthetase [Pelagibaculum spongiae]PVZ68900.1 hypothetical protein DC094_11650 [Pelagibaculum spongiae]
MSNDQLKQRLAGLSEAQRRHLLQKLRQQQSQTASRQQKNAAVTQSNVIPAQIEAEDYPLSFAQQRMWFIDQMSDHREALNIPLILHLTGQLNVAALEQSLKILVGRHSMLRANFIHHHGEARLKLQTAGKFELHQEDLSHHATPEILAKEHARLEAATPFDLIHQLPFRARLLQLSLDKNQQQYWLLLTVHHIVADGASMEVLVSELSQLYQQLVAKKPTELASLPLQYTDYSVWQRSLAEKGEFAKELEWWRSQLKDLPELLRLRTDHSRPVQPSGKGAIFHFPLNNRLLDSLQQLALDQNSTLFMLLLSGFQGILSRWSDQSEIAVAIPGSGRSHTQLEPLVGCFVNSLVAHASVAENPTLEQLNQQTSERVKQVFNHQQLPFDLLIDQLGITRKSSHAPLVQVGFGMSRDPQMPQLPGLELQIKEPERATAKYDLLLMARQKSTGVELSVEYSTDLYQQSSIELMAQQYQNLLQAMVEIPKALLASVPLWDGIDLAKRLNPTAISSDQSINPMLPLTQMQRDLYLESSLNRDGLVNSVGVYAETDYQIDPTLWQQAVQQVSDAHPSMRSSVFKCDLPGADVAYQQENNSWPIEFRFDQLAADQLQIWLNQQVKQPWDLHNNRPPVRFGLIHLDNGKSVCWLAIHHMFSDGFSMMAMLKQQIKCYRGETLQVDDYFQQDVAQLNQQMDTAEILDYWKPLLESCEPLQPDENSAGKPERVDLEYKLDNQHWRQIQNYCQQLSIHPSVYFRYIYALLLKMLCRSEENFQLLDVHHGRLKEQMQHLGCYFQQVPLVIENSWLEPENKTVSQGMLQLAQAIRQVAPYRKISVLRQHQLSDSGRLNFMFNFYSFKNQLDISGENLDAKFINPDVPELVELIVEPESDVAAELQNLRLSLKFVESEFADRNLLQRIDGISRQILAGTEQLSQLQWISAEEQKQQIESWNQQVESPWQEDIGQRFNRVAIEHGARTAVSFVDQKLSYAELEQYSAKVAHWVSQRITQPGQPVAICLERSQWLPVMILGVLRAGASYLPIDPIFPDQRIEYILGDSETELLISDSHLLDRLTQFNGQSLLIDQSDIDHTNAGLHWLNLPAQFTPLAVKPDDLAYSIYTSGTTGNPKGVAITRHNMLRLFDISQPIFKFSHQDVWSLFHSYAFDFSVWEIWGALLYGAELVIVPSETAKDSDAFYQLLVDQKVTFLNQTPSAFSQIIRIDGQKRLPLSLRCVVFGGEALDFPALDQWYQQHQPDQPLLVNMYGITETTVHVTWHPISLQDVRRGISIIGKPLADLQGFVLDPQQRMLPVGVAGELHVAGAGVSPGYQNRSELTAEKFISHALGQLQNSQGKLYRSGDLCRYDIDEISGIEKNITGQLEYLGRIDHQVKIRGYRIELGEIISAISQHPNIHEAVVRVREITAGNPQLVAWLVAADQQTAGRLDFDQLRAHLEQSLPSYMVPNAYIWIDSLPLTANGKVNDKLLADPELQQQNRYVAPKTEIQQQLVEIWCELLGLDQVGIRDNFFELGGHSLLATRMMARIRDRLDTEISLKQLFEAPEIERLESLIETSRQHSGAQVEILPVDPQQTVFASAEQRRIWFAEQLEPGAAYLIPAAFELNGQLNIAALENAINQIIQRHSSLRSYFPADNGLPLLAVNYLSDFSLPVVDLTQLPQTLAQQEHQALLLAEAMTPMDLEYGPLYRFKLLKLEAEQHLLLITLHHTIADGWSMGVLMRELSILYSQRIENNSNDEFLGLPDLTVDYRDYAAWQEKWRQQPEAQQMLQWWQSNLQGLPELQLPEKLTSNLSANQELMQSGREYLFALDQQLTESLQKLASQSGVTLFELLLSSWGWLISQYSNSSDLCIGTPIAGRQTSQLEPMLGCFVNMLCLRLKFSGQQTAQQAIAHAAQVHRLAQQYQQLPYDLLVESLNHQRKQAPFFRSVFTLNSESPQQDLLLPGLEIHQAHAPVTSAKFDLALGMYIKQGRLQGGLNWRDAMFEQTLMHSMVENFKKLLQSICLQPQQPLRQLNYLSDHDRLNKRQIINPQTAKSSLNWTAAQLLAMQCESYPGRSAIRFDGVELQFHELNQRAQALADWLLEQGIYPGSTVAIDMPLDECFVVSVIAMWKIGAIPLPLDGLTPDPNNQAALAVANLLLTDWQRRDRFALSCSSVAIDLHHLPLAGNEQPLQVIEHRLWSLLSDGAIQQIDTVELIPALEQIRQTLQCGQDHPDTLALTHDQQSIDFILQFSMLLFGDCLQLDMFESDQLQLGKIAKVDVLPLDQQQLFEFSPQIQQQLKQQSNLSIWLNLNQSINPALLELPLAIKQSCHLSLVKKNGQLLGFAEYQPQDRCFELQAAVGQTLQVSDSAGQPIPAFAIGYLNQQLDLQPNQSEVLPILVRQHQDKLLLLADVVSVSESESSLSDQHQQQATSAEQIWLEGPLEQQIASIWQPLLQLENLPDRRANFFLIGGHSLLASQVVARLKKQLSLAISLKMLFDHPVLADFAEQISALQQSTILQETGFTDRPALLPTGETQGPLSWAQQRLWFVQQMDLDDPAYNMPAAVKLTGRLNIAALNQAVFKLLERHQVLRSYFSVHNNQPLQKILPNEFSEIPLLDLTTLSQASIEQEQQRILQREAEKPFDLQRGPLIRVQLVKLTAKQHILQLTVHHIAADGWSIDLLLKEISEGYLAACENRSPELPALPVQYLDFSLWQRSWLDQQQLQQQLDYWKNQLQDAPALLSMPLDRPRSDVTDRTADTVEFSVSPNLSQQLVSLAKQQNVTPYMLMLSSWQMLLARWTDQSDICIGVPEAGRNLPELEPLIGCFVNAQIIRQQFKGNPSFIQSLQQTRLAVMGALSNSEAPIDMVIDALAVERSKHYEPLAQSGFSWLSQGPLQLQMDQLQVESLQVFTGRAKYDLIMALGLDQQGQLQGALEYCTGLFNRSSMQRLLDAWQLLLAQLVEMPEITLQRLALDSADTSGMPLSPVQRDLALQSLRDPQSQSNSFGLVLPLPRLLDPQTLQQALDQLIQHQPYLNHRLYNRKELWNGPLWLSPSQQSLTVQSLDWRHFYYDQSTLIDHAEQLIRQPWQVIDQPLFQIGHILTDQCSYLLLRNHHLLVDGIGCVQIAQQLIDCYQALENNNPIELPQPMIADDMRLLRQITDQSEHLEFWQQALANSEAATLLKKPLPAAITAEVESGLKPQRKLIRVDLNKQLWLDVQQAAEQQNVSLPNLCRAIYALQIQSVTHAQHDFCLTEFASGRTIEQLTAAGCYYQPVPCLIEHDWLAGDNTITELANQIRLSRRQGQKHLPISPMAQKQLVNAGQAGFMFNFINFLQGIEFERNSLPFVDFSPSVDGQTQLVLKAQENSLEMQLYCDADFAAEQWLQQMESLLGQFVAAHAEQQTLTLSDLQMCLPNSLLSKTQNNAAIYDAREMAQSVNLVASISQQFTESAAKHSNNIVIESSQGSLTYQQFAQQVARFAVLLQQQGVTSGDRIAICGDLTSELLASIMAVIGCGASYLPIDASIPVGRIQQIIEDAQPTLIICQPDKLPELTRLVTELAPEQLISPVQLLSFDQLSAQAAALTSSQSQLDNWNAPDTNSLTPLYAIFTSGSTGRPKGAQVRRDSFINLLNWYLNDAGLDQQQTLLPISSIGFDLTQKNLIAPLLAGAKLVLPTTASYDLLQIRQLIEQHKVSWLNCAPSAFYPLLESDLEGGLQTIASIKTLVLGGEAVQLSRLKDWLVSNQTRLINSYGPTEATDVVCYSELSGQQLVDQQYITLGQPISGVKLQVCDGQQRVLAQGMIGELVISGIAVGDGYIGQNQLTEQSFPLINGEKCYLTGDLGWMENNRFHYLRRRDFQLKLNGLRMEPGEIEQRVQQLDGIIEAIVQPQDNLLGCWVLLDTKTATPETSQIMTHLRQYLPDYMVPAFFVALDHWPLNASGKVDRKSLPAPQQAEVENIPPTTELQVDLAAIWCELLGVTEVSINQDFFQLGGHSLLVAQMVARISQRFEIEIPLRELFEMRTIADISDYIESVRWAVNAAAPQNEFSEFTDFDDLPDAELESEHTVQKQNNQSEQEESEAVRDEGFL